MKVKPFSAEYFHNRVDRALTGMYRDEHITAEEVVVDPSTVLEDKYSDTFFLTYLIPQILFNGKKLVFFSRDATIALHALGNLVASSGRQVYRFPLAYDPLLAPAEESWDDHRTGRKSTSDTDEYQQWRNVKNGIEFLKESAHLVSSFTELVEILNNEETMKQIIAEKIAVRRAKRRLKRQERVQFTPEHLPRGTIFEVDPWISERAYNVPETGAYVVDQLICNNIDSFCVICNSAAMEVNPATNSRQIGFNISYITKILRRGDFGPSLAGQEKSKHLSLERGFGRYSYMSYTNIIPMLPQVARGAGHDIDRLVEACKKALPKPHTLSKELQVMCYPNNLRPTKAVKRWIKANANRYLIGDKVCAEIAEIDDHQSYVESEDY
jgi:hypothetical protein